MAPQFSKSSISDEINGTPLKGGVTDFSHHYHFTGKIISDANIISWVFVKCSLNFRSKIISRLKSFLLRSAARGRFPRTLFTVSETKQKHLKQIWKYEFWILKTKLNFEFSRFVFFQMFWGKQCEPPSEVSRGSVSRSRPTMCSFLKFKIHNFKIQICSFEFRILMLFIGFPSSQKFRKLWSPNVVRRLLNFPANIISRLKSFLR